MAGSLENPIWLERIMPRRSLLRIVLAICVIAVSAIGTTAHAAPSATGTFTVSNYSNSVFKCDSKFWFVRNDWMCKGKLIRRTACRGGVQMQTVHVDSYFKLRARTAISSGYNARPYAVRC
jgi:hypothetical protein